MNVETGIVYLKGKLRLAHYCCSWPPEREICSSSLVEMEFYQTLLKLELYMCDTCSLLLLVFLSCILLIRVSKYGYSDSYTQVCCVSYTLENNITISMLYRRIRNLELLTLLYVYQNNIKLYVFSIEHTIDGVLKNANHFSCLHGGFSTKFSTYS